eukprot:2056060-Rhodomonas_salina.1
MKSCGVKASMPWHVIHARQCGNEVFSAFSITLTTAEVLLEWDASARQRTARKLLASVPAMIALRVFPVSPPDGPARETV